MTLSVLALYTSSSTWRTWIEIDGSKADDPVKIVVLHLEDVD